jgi:translocation and assembly module TamA
MRALLAVLGIVLGVAPHGARAQEATPQGPTTAVDERVPYRIIITGADRYAEVIERHITLARRNDERRATRDRIERLMRGIPEEVAGMLAAEGYYSPRVTTRLDDSSQPLTVAIAIELGEPVRVASVRFRFEGAITEGGDTTKTEPSEASTQRAFSLAPGAVFRSEDWEFAKRAALRHLLALRYPTARLVDSRADVDPQARTAALEVTYASGPAYRFGPVSVTGLARYPSRVVQTLRIIEPGMVFSQSALADLQSRLQQTPYFSSVSVTVDPQSGDPSALPVKIEVTEAERRRLDLGVGFSTDSGGRLQANYTDANLFDRGLRWRNQVRWDQKGQLASTQLAWPVRPDGWQDDLGLQWAHTDVRGFDVRAYTLTAKRSKTEGRIERAATLTAVISNEFPVGGTSTNNQALVPGYSWRYRVFDNVIDPRNGWEVAMQAGVGVKVLLSDQDFLRSYGRIVGVYSPTEQDTFVARAEGGAIFARSRQGIPDQFLFRAGGDQSLRGYAFQSIGVQVGGATVGARYLGIGGAEYIRWVRPKWGVAGFIERGDAFDRYEERRWRTGYGIGARVRSAVGPINADIAYGTETRSVRIHVSLGFVF